MLILMRSYWDWTLDWEDPLSSPVFDPMTGFGGDGDRQQPSSTGVGYCLTDVLIHLPAFESLN